MLPFEIREQLNLTLARPYLTFKSRARKRDCTSDISNIVVFTRHVSRYKYPYFKLIYRVPIRFAIAYSTFSRLGRRQTMQNNSEDLSLSPRMLMDYTKKRI